MLPQQALVRLIELAARLHDQEEIIGGFRKNTVRHGPRHDDVIALLKSQGAEIRLYGALAPVHENQLVAIGVAIVEGHRCGAARDVQLQILISQERNRKPLRIV